MTLEDKLNNYLEYENGFYIECGSNDGIFQTNTYKLEKLKNWKGMLIEASLESYEKCLENRDNNNNIILNNALVSFEHNDEYISGDFDGSLMSSIGGNRLNREPNIKVVAKTITSILKEYNIEKVDVFIISFQIYYYFE